ncbi:thiamine pyrophosphate-binding protein [Ramlibacter sp. Leaf400]|uniref:thiamine pyrophosphate-binding protein n=1 Tax=Ramlibacter sp. Leaf400 TaxID=1736365 RepID=UPI0006FF7350|nr:thiamine pyrophosphate-binding protein [Ramlibacter sp. Leaf400]KQT13328.1 hypothetical protein ASG30_20445 [Ramlibacter sp. Leaf400]
MTGQPAPAATRGFESLAQQLKEARFTGLFGLMGDANLDLVAACVQRHGLRFVAARTEAGAVAMADGCARVTGRPALATVTCGPGLTNAITALTTAVRAGTPLLLVTGQIPLQAVSRNQRFDHAAVLAPTGAAVLTIESAQQLHGCVARALALLNEQGRPVVLNVMVPVLDGQAPGGGDAEADTAPRAQNPAPAPAPEALQLFARKLTQARRPVLLAGRGAVRAGALDALGQLADRTGAMLATTLCAKDAFAGSPRDLGLSGGFALEAGACVLRDADLIVAFGANLNAWTTAAGSAYGQAEILQCDADPSAFARASVALAGHWQGDAAGCTRQLLAALPAGERPAWHAPVAREDGPAAAHGATGGRVDPRALCAWLDRRLPADRLLAVDGGHFFEFPSKFIRVPRASASIFSLDFGSIGLAMGMGLGAAVGQPASLSVIAVGDGGFMMALPELDTAVRHRIPSLFVVFNDAAYGAEVKHLEERGWSPELAAFDMPDIARLATSMGARGITVRSVADLESHAAQIAAPTGPLVLDVHIDPAIEAEWIGLARRIRGR